MFTFSRPICYAALLLTSAAIAACGGASSSSSSTPSSPSSSGAGAATQAQVSDGHGARVSAAELGQAVATVGAASITRAALQRQAALMATAKLPVPRSLASSACASALHTVGEGGVSSELKGECLSGYEHIRSVALSALIHSQWLLGEARDEGLGLDEQQLAHEFTLSKAEEPRFQDALARSGQSVAEFKAELELAQFSDRIYKYAEAKTPKATHAELVSFYQAHKHSYDLPEQRDLHIIRTTSDAAARKVLRELRAGQSFAEVAKGIKVPQPIGTKEGLLRGLQPKEFTEPVLAEPIFRARPKDLVGPVRISLGYYVFEVTHISPPHRRTFAEVQGAIKAQLPELLRNQTLAGFVKDFRRKWTARTDCRPGYAVENCKQYKAPAGAPSKDDYTI